MIRKPHEWLSEASPSQIGEMVRLLDRRGYLGKEFRIPRCPFRATDTNVAGEINQQLDEQLYQYGFSPYNSMAIYKDLTTDAGPCYSIRIHGALGDHGQYVGDVIWQEHAETVEGIWEKFVLWLFKNDRRK